MGIELEQIGRRATQLNASSYGVVEEALARRTESVVTAARGLRPHQRIKITYPSSHTEEGPIIGLKIDGKVLIHVDGFRIMDTYFKERDNVLMLGLLREGVARIVPGFRYTGSRGPIPLSEIEAIEPI